VPAQTGFAEGAMVILTGNEPTDIVTVLDVAGFPVGHDKLEVRIQVTASLFNGI